MAGKSWQLSHEPPCRKGKKAPITLKKQWKEGGKGWEKLPGWWAVTPNNAANTHLKHMQECLQWRAHGIQTHAHMQKTKECWMLFVVNSLKLHLKKKCSVCNSMSNQQFSPSLFHTIPWNWGGRIWCYIKWNPISFFVLNILPVCWMDNVLKIEGKPHVTNFLWLGFTP